jgi:hypothetical protein
LTILNFCYSQFEFFNKGSSGSSQSRFSSYEESFFYEFFKDSRIKFVALSKQTITNSKIYNPYLLYVEMFFYKEQPISKNNWFIVDFWEYNSISLVFEAISASHVKKIYKDWIKRYCI